MNNLDIKYDIKMLFGQVVDVIFTNEEFIIISTNHACIIRILSDCYKTNIIMDDYKQMIGKHIKQISTHGKTFKNHGFNCHDCKYVKIEFTDCEMYVYGVANVKKNQVFNMQVMYSLSTYVSERTYNLGNEYESLEDCYDLANEYDEYEVTEDCYDLDNEYGEQDEYGVTEDYYNLANEYGGYEVIEDCYNFF